MNTSRFGELTHWQARSFEMPDFSAVLGVLGGTSTLLLALKWLVGKLVDSKLKEANDKHKAKLDRELEELKSELTAKTEELKSGLARLAHEKGVAISRIDGERSKAAAEIFSEVRKLYGILSRSSAILSVKSATMTAVEYVQLGGEIPSQINRITDSVNERAIYISEECIRAIWQLTNYISKTVLPTLDFEISNNIDANLLRQRCERTRDAASLAHRESVELYIPALRALRLAAGTIQE
jgi:predicted transcriptional regulator